MVINIVPTPNNGVAVRMSNNQKAGRAPISRAKKRSTITLENRREQRRKKPDAEFVVAEQATC